MHEPQKSAAINLALASRPTYASSLSLSHANASLPEGRRQTLYLALTSAGPINVAFRQPSGEYRSNRFCI